MRFLLCFLLLLTAHTSSRAATYYISNSGSDTNDGLSASTPLQTLTALSALIFQPGDSVLFASGEIFYGSFQVQMNGGAIKRFYIGIYNGSARAIISGGISLSNWTINGNIATHPVTENISAVFLQNQRQVPARFPNNSFLTVNAVTGTNGFTCDALNQATDYWNNAQVHIRSTPNQFETASIQQFDNGIITFNNPIANVPAIGNGFYIDHTIQALDTVGEWYYDALTSLLYYIPQSPSDLNSGNIIGITQEYGIAFTAPCDSITIEHLEFRYQNNAAIYFSSSLTNTIINQNHFYFGNDAAVKSNGMATKLTFSSNTVKDYLTNGLHFFQLWYSAIMNNNFQDIGLVAGQGRAGYFQYTPVFAGFMAYSNISDNVILRFGNSAIKTDGPYNTYKRNYIKDGMLSLTSSGAFNFYGEICKELVIEDNFILNVTGNQDALAQKDALICGILMNAFCHDNIIKHNTIANAGNYGMYIATGNYQHQITQNLFYNSQLAHLTLNDFYGVPGSNKDHQITHNTFYSLSASQAALQYETFNAANQFSLSDSNFFCNPYDYKAIRETYLIEEFVTKEYALPIWQKNQALDSASYAMRLTLNQYQIEAESAPELITNGNFTNNFDNWSLLFEDGVEMLLDNETEMDGGCVKLLIQDNSLDFAQLYSKTFSIFDGSFYRLRYSVLGDKNSYMNASVYINGEDYRDIGLERNVTYGTNRTERELIFKSNEDCVNCGLRFSIFQGDSMLLLDNISLRQVTVQPLDSTKVNRLFLNYSAQTISINLYDTIYTDILGNTVSGSISLPPYGSLVLIPQNVIYNSIKEPPVSSNTLTPFPNPASDKIYIRLPSEIHSSAHIEVYNISGSLITSFEEKDTAILEIPLSNLAPGLYMLRMVSDSALHTVRFVKW